MADKRISDFDSIQSNQDTDLMLVSVNGVTYNETAQTLKAYASAGTVKYDSTQNLTSAQQQQARSNIGAGSASAVSDLESDVTNIESDISDINDDITSLENSKATKTQLATAVSYSTTETLTGGTWTDGKPIYRKVIPWNGTPGATTTLDYYPSTLDTLVSCLVYYVQADYIMQVPYTNGSYGLHWYMRRSDRAIILAAGTSARVSSTIHIIMEYTKTTDSGS